MFINHVFLFTFPAYAFAVIIMLLLECTFHSEENLALALNQFRDQQCDHAGNDYGSVGRAVVSHFRGPLFESYFINSVIICWNKSGQISLNYDWPNK